MLNHLWVEGSPDEHCLREHYGEVYFENEDYLRKYFDYDTKVLATKSDIPCAGLAGFSFQKIIIREVVSLKVFKMLLERLYYEGEIISADKYYSFGAVEMEVLGEGVGYIDYPTHNGKREFIRLDTLDTVDVRELYNKIDWREVGRNYVEQ